jgi:signal peptidase I
MMGDNRNDSNDSRAFGPVTHERLVGEAIVRYWPLQSVGLVSHLAYPG